METTNLKRRIATALVGVQAGLTALVGCDAINPPQYLEDTYSGTIKAIDAHGKKVEYRVLVADYSRKPGEEPERRVITVEAVDDKTVPNRMYAEDYGNNGYDTIEVYRGPEDANPSIAKTRLGSISPSNAGKEISKAWDFLNAAEREVVPLDELFK